MNRISEKAISSKNGDVDGVDYKMEWSSSSDKYKYPVKSIGEKEDVIRGNQQDSQNKIDQSIQRAKYLERFTLVIIVALAFGLLIQQGTICVAK